jgi:hypothetical protein
MMNMKQTFKKAFFLHYEWLALTMALLAMALLNPESASASVCPLDLMGFESCPGQGLGKSIAYSFRGEFQESIKAHPVGLVSILIIMGRIGSIFKRNSQLSKFKVKSDENI